MNQTEVLEDTFGANGYDPRLYEHTQVVEPINGFDAVTSAHVEAFHETGFIAIQNAFDAQVVANAMDAVGQLIDGQVGDFKGVQFEKGHREEVDEATGQNRELLVRKLTRFVGFDPRLDVFADDPNLIRILSLIMGEPPQLFANQAMLKPPGIGREKPWHQDHAYFDLPLDTCIVSAWIALDPATPENGCMRVIPRSHHDGPVIHFNRRDWQICDTDVALKNIAAVPLLPGGVLLWHGRLHHGTPANRSTQRRRALQLHYVPQSAEVTAKEERLAAFGSDGKDVSC